MADVRFDTVRYRVATVGHRAGAGSVWPSSGAEPEGGFERVVIHCGRAASRSFAKSRSVP